MVEQLEEINCQFRNEETGDCHKLKQWQKVMKTKIVKCSDMARPEERCGLSTIVDLVISRRNDL